MNCYLCGLEAKELQSDGHGQHVDCPDCGDYVISNLVKRELGGRQIDYVRLRGDMHRQRQVNATSTAQINTETVIWK